MSSPSQRGLALALWGLLALACVSAVTWIGLAAWTSGRGLDVTDESLYLLSYRWWNVDLETFTGAQYLYGPAFQALGYDIADLRLFRLASVIVVHSAFAVCFARWLTQGPWRLSNSRLAPWVSGATVFAAGGATYGWLPLSPGYNDVALLGSLALAAIWLHGVTRNQQGSRAPWWIWVLAGPVAVAMALAKWPSLVIVAVVLLTGSVVIFGRSSLRELGRMVGWALAGALAALVVINMAVIPLTEAVPAMLAATRRVGAVTNSPTALIGMYITTTMALLRRTVASFPLLLVGAALAGVLRGVWPHRLASLILAVGLVSLAWSIAQGALDGGSANLPIYTASLTLPVLLVAIVAGLSRAAGTPSAEPSEQPGEGPTAPKRRDWVVGFVLLCLPFAQGFGTGNPLVYVAVNGFAFWAAATILMATTLPGRTTTAGIAQLAAVAMTVVFPAAIAWSAFVDHPYRTAPPAQDTMRVANSKPLESLRLDPAHARSYAALRDALSPWVENSGRPVMAFDELPGLVLLLDGRTVGEAWYSASDRDRTAAAIVSACARNPLTGDRRPVIIFNRPIAPSDEDALKVCGLSLSRDYAPLTGVPDDLDIVVYVPR